MEGLLSLVSLTFALEIDLDSTYYLIFLKPLISYSPEIAIKLFEHLKTKSNSNLDIKVYTNLIDGILRKSESFEVAYKLIEEIPPQLKTIKVERTISNVLLQAYFRYYDMERCLNFYSNMLESPGTDIYTYSILFQRFSHYKKANVNPTYEPNLDMFREDMKKYNIRPNGIIYNMLIKCYLKINYSKALEILDERIACDFKPDEYTYAMFTIYASKVKKDISLTLYWFEKIIEAGMKPIPEVVTAVLNVIKREHDIESAKLVKDLLNRCRYKPSLSDHIDRFVFNVENNIPPINIKKPKKRWLKVNIG
ncbi:hypothetical protein K502DRAFT_328130 [Neoconidiobolus thromboides FSU 785]|nr:hypothetical protein K502DRAFT_328130 [Neoconidiobolus thromboides FSU 785]